MEKEGWKGETEKRNDRRILQSNKFKSQVCPLLTGQDFCFLSLNQDVLCTDVEFPSTEPVIHLFALNVGRNHVESGVWNLQTCSRV